MLSACGYSGLRDSTTTITGNTLQAANTIIQAIESLQHDGAAWGVPDD